MASPSVLNVTICGGGNGAHTLAGIASKNPELSVTVLDVYEDETERWDQALVQNGFTVNLPNGDRLKQLPGDVKFKVTRDVKGAIAAANVVITICPAYAHQVYVDLIVEHLSDDAFVVGMPGQPGFEYQWLYYLRKHGKKCSLMALETLPWACRINKYGSDVSVLGFKDEVKTSLINQRTPVLDPISTTQNIIGRVPVLKQASHALEIGLLAKAIIHPPILYARWKNWNREELDTKPLFYQGVDDLAIKYLDAACNEVIATAEVLKQKYPQFKQLKIGSMHQWMIDHYSDQISDKSTLMSSLQTCKAYDGLVHPMTQTSSRKFVPDFTYRYMREDVPYGIVVQRAIAEMVGVKTPALDEIITWAQEILGVDYLIDGKINEKLMSKTRIPQMYGLNSIDDLLKFCESVA